MRSGAFDVTVGNINVHNMTSKNFARARPTPAVAAEEAPPHALFPAITPLADKILCYNMPVLCVLMALYSSYVALPYAGTIVNTVTLELSPVAILMSSDGSARRHHAIFAVCASISLFVLPDPQRQVFLSYPTYVALVCVALFLMAGIAKPRHTDTLLLAGVGLAVLSALLLRNVMAHQTRLVQAVELTLLALCACAYGFMHARRSAVPAQPG